MRATPLWCWGGNYYGVIGIGTHGFGGRMEDEDVEHTVVKHPTRVASLAGKVAAVGCGSIDTCAVTMDGALLCWGNGENPKGTEPFSDVPVRRDIGGKTIGLALKEDHACAIREDHTLWCWGGNNYGQLGPGPPAPGSAPNYAPATQLKALANHVASAAVLQDSTCALKDDSALWCWGLNREGELGDGTYEKRLEPTRAIAPERFRSVAAAAHHVCGLTLDDRLLCWGSNYEGQLGNGQPPKTKPVNHATAQAVVTPFKGIRSMALGDNSTFVVLEHGELYAWGDLVAGMRGFTSNPKSTPQKLVMPGPVVEIATHATHRCALLSDDSVWCWGKGDDYELGNGQSDDHDAPVRVVFPK